MARRCSKRNDAEDLVMNFIVLLLVLPFIGAYFLGKKEPEKKMLGGVLLITGIVIWAAMSA